MLEDRSVFGIPSSDVERPEEYRFRAYLSKLNQQSFLAQNSSWLAGHPVDSDFQALHHLVQCRGLDL